VSLGSWRHTLSMAFSLCPSPPLPPSPSPPPSPWALSLTHTEFGYSLCPSPTPTLPAETHTEYGFLFVSLSHSPTLPFSPSILMLEKSRVTRQARRDSGCHTQSLACTC